MYENYKIHNSMKRYVKYVFATTLHRLRDMSVFQDRGPSADLDRPIQGSVASIGFFMALSWPLLKIVFWQRWLEVSFPTLTNPGVAMFGRWIPLLVAWQLGWWVFVTPCDPFFFKNIGYFDPNCLRIVTLPSSVLLIDILSGEVNVLGVNRACVFLLSFPKKLLLLYYSSSNNSGKWKVD